MDKRYFYFGNKLSAVADKRLNNPTVISFWNGFCSGSGEIELSAGNSNTMLIGSAKIRQPESNDEYIISVEENGISVAAKDYNGLARGYMALLQKIEPVELDKGSEQFRIPCGVFHGKYSVKTRMIHFCVFHETSLSFLQKCIRLAGVMQYTHIILEFWGMLRFDCLYELGWREAYTKQQISPLIREIRDMGMEPVPMMNHLGHASASRMICGKHVVLDQNPQLQMLFMPDGWSWNVRSDRVRGLLYEIRKELYELFGPGEYFHAGCDEAYQFVHDDELQGLLPEYFRYVSNEIIKEGRRPIIWGDMLLDAKACNIPENERYCCNCATEMNAANIMKLLPRDTIIADWQYEIKKAPFLTSQYLQKNNFEVLVSPFSDSDNGKAAIKTAAEEQMLGVILTTWGTLKAEAASILKFAYLFGAQGVSWSAFIGGETNVPLAFESSRLETAALMRKISPVSKEYSDCGWMSEQISY